PMARIAGVDLPREKRGEVALTYIYGIGRPTALRVLSQARVDHNKRVKAWSEDETGRVREILEREVKVEGDLRREISMNVKRLMDIGTYRGIRHRRGLAERGQRRLQGLSQEHALRRSDRRRAGRPQGDGVRLEDDRSLREGPGRRARGGHPLAAGHRTRGHCDSRCHSHPARRLPAAEAATGVGGGPMARYRDAKCRLCRREGRKLFLKGARS